ncbi:hypothetical protein [Acinetobacter baumannii]|uniref:hypothetical protein n=1 Tax=Acinetobacter baumannii TaxID=470 RepID=UPI00148AB7AD|nr:hypothetical protein [Acinetobacter baumannii]
MLETIVIWFVELLTELALIVISPLLALNWLLCRLIGRNYQLDCKLKAPLIGKGASHE